MDHITVYEKPTCTTCRKLSKLLIESGVNFEKVNYFVQSIPKNKLKSLIRKIGIKPADLLRKNEKIYKELNFKTKNYSDEQIIDLIVMHPELLQRPIVEKGERAILARPVEKILPLIT